MNSAALRFLLLFIVTQIGCEDAIPTTAPPLPLPPQMSGTWSGGNAFLFRVHTVESNAEISGTGMFNGQIGAFITGKSNYPNISFTISSQGFEPATYSGRFIHADSIDGKLDGSGFSGTRVVLRRE